MSHRGWNLNTLQHPACLHLCVTVCHVGKAREFLRDLALSTLEAASITGNVNTVPWYGFTLCRSDMKLLSFCVCLHK